MLFRSKKAFEDQKEIDNHVQMIEQENQISNRDLRTIELKNWIDYLNEN